MSKPSREKSDLIREIGDEVFGTAERPDERLGRGALERRLVGTSYAELERIKQRIVEDPSYKP